MPALIVALACAAIGFTLILAAAFWPIRPDIPERRRRPF